MLPLKEINVFYIVFVHSSVISYMFYLQLLSYSYLNLNLQFQFLDTDIEIQTNKNIN